jgi:hypothetical protein
MAMFKYLKEKPYIPIALAIALILFGYNVLGIGVDPFAKEAIVILDDIVNHLNSKEYAEVIDKYSLTYPNKSRDQIITEYENGYGDYLARKLSYSRRNYEVHGDMVYFRLSHSDTVDLLNRGAKGVMELTIIFKSGGRWYFKE